METTAEDIVREHISIDSVTSQGWEMSYCEVCGDGTHSKGPRGGWRLDGNSIAFNCFNCNASGNFDAEREIAYSKEMRNIFDSFGIPRSELGYIIAKNKSKSKNNNKIKKSYNQAKPIKIPTCFYTLQEFKGSKNLLKAALLELKRRNVSPNDYTFYLVNDKDIKKNNEFYKFRNRLIIPYFKNGKPIYFEGLDLTGKSIKKYLSCEKSSEGVVYGFENLYNRSLKSPLFVTEGFWDAYHVSGVAVFQNKLTRDKIEILEACKREKIVIPDRGNDYHNLANQAIDLGWKLSLPKLNGCKDIDESIRYNGKIFTFNEIVSNIVSGETANVRLKIWNM